MAWGKIDDTHYDHPKVREIPRAIRNEAIGLYWRAISLCNRVLSDGKVTPSDLELLDGTPKLATELVRAKLWERSGRGWRVHDFLDFNKSRIEVLEEREKRAAAGRAGGLASGRRRRESRSDQSKSEPNPKQPLQPRSKREARRSSTVEPPARPYTRPREALSPDVESASRAREGRAALLPLCSEISDAIGAPPTWGAARWEFRELETLVERHGLEKVRSTAFDAIADLTGPDAVIVNSQVVAEVRNRLHPLPSGTSKRKPPSKHTDSIDPDAWKDA